MTLNDASWFTEVDKANGSAWSLRIKSKLHEERTDYQLIEIYDTTDFGHLMVIDGFVMLTSRDNFLYHEMMSHPVLLTHPDPRKVVIIGGGDCGTLHEVLKHPGVESVLQVEIDERVTRLSEQYFPELCASNRDSRADFYFGDGIAWMKQATGGSLDIIIVDSTDPIGPAEGLFTEAFYRDCRRALGDTGWLVQQSESPLYHQDTIIRPMRQAMQAAGFDQVATLTFPQPCYPSGWWSATLAGAADPHQFRAAADLSTAYYSGDIHRASLATPPFMR